MLKNENNFKLKKDERSSIFNQMSGHRLNEWFGLKNKTSRADRFTTVPNRRVKFGYEQYKRHLFFFIKIFVV